MPGSSPESGRRTLCSSHRSSRWRNPSYCNRLRRNCRTRRTHRSLANRGCNRDSRTRRSSFRIVLDRRAIRNRDGIGRRDRRCSSRCWKPLASPAGRLKAVCAWVFPWLCSQPAGRLHGGPSLMPRLPNKSVPKPCRRRLDFSAAASPTGRGPLDLSAPKSSKSNKSLPAERPTESAAGGVNCQSGGRGVP